MRYIFCILFGLTLIPTSRAQSNKDYPQNYFRNPLNIPILLAGNFGECRPNHFHSGIDIKTEGKENLPVFAAADGYISRIKMEKGGFGHALYITHPNGFTTLYAHLNDFIPSVQKHLKTIQYERESWSVDITLSTESFPVKKGQQIAWSGNTGSSSAPHLHFEIRDTKTEHPLNPQLFGFDINDSRSPVPTQIALYDLHQSIYRQSPQIISLKKTDSVYSPNKDTITINSDKIGIAVNADDFMNGSNNTLNFYTADWFEDGAQIGSIRLDDIGYDVTRYLHAYVDYRLKKLNNQWYQLLFLLQGNKLKHIYQYLNDQQGSIAFIDSSVHQVRIDLQDASGNRSVIALHLKSAGVSQEYQCKRIFEANSVNAFDHPNVRFRLSEDDLYDDVCFVFSKLADTTAFSDKMKIGDASIPVHKYFDLFIKPNKLIPFKLRDKIVLKHSDGKTENGRAANFENGWYKTSVRNFGTYWLAADTTAPVISSLQKEGADLSKATRISFSVKENTTSVKKFRAALDGKWIAFEPRGDTFFYTFDEHCPKGKHKMVIYASDENGNHKTLVYTFTR